MHAGNRCYIRYHSDFIIRTAIPSKANIYPRERHLSRCLSCFGINLTARELALFRFFLEHPGQVFTKEQLYRQVWNENVVDDNTIMVYIKRIREKTEEDSRKPVYLKTVRGIGYLFNSQPNPEKH